MAIIEWKKERNHMIQKAFILGAGLGMRLRPLTVQRPKPTLPVLGRPLIEYVIDHLKAVGVKETVINTHHCPDVYHQLLKDGKRLNVKVNYSHEEILLDTGGGLKKVESFFQKGTFVMYNGDILTDGDLVKAVEFHKKQKNLATLILGKFEGLQNVALNSKDQITDMRGVLGDKTNPQYVFTGIQILEPEIFQHIQPNQIISIVDVYLQLIREGKKIGGFIWDFCFWSDLGSLENYSQVQRQIVDSPELRNKFSIRSLGQDGSDRRYYRTGRDSQTTVVMRYGKEKEENGFYDRISSFLKELAIPVPDIFYRDLEHGLLCVEDLGNITLCQAFQEKERNQVLDLYKEVIEKILILHQKGSLLYQKTPFSLSQSFTEKIYLWESNYFKENLLENVFHLTFDKQLQVELESDFRKLAKTLSKEERVLIHRDLQSKNIMIKQDHPYFIDFQGMRWGLAGYDLASLLYDPYVDLAEEERELLYQYYVDCAGPFIEKVDHFRKNYESLILQRLMQALGAYGFLGLKKGKTHFLTYIQPALERLGKVLGRMEGLDGIKTVTTIAIETMKKDACFCDKSKKYGIISSLK